METNRKTAIIVVAVALAVVAGAIIVFLSSRDSAPDDGGAVELPQNPSLRLAEAEGVWFVENDGNVTMSEIVVRDGSAVICELGTLSPGERSDCDEAEGGEGLSAFGLSPQGQEVETGPS